MTEFKLKHNRIGVLTSGGDCAGLNAAIRAITLRAANEYGLTVIGILASTAGLLERPIRFMELDPKRCDADLLRRGGTILETINKGNPFEYPMPDGTIKDRSEEAIAGFRALHLDALIGIGGDGSMRILARLAEQGHIPFIGVPKTIDNDVAETDFSTGYMTAVELAVEALDRLAPTAASHRRVMVLEVMGRDVGWIALVIRHRRRRRHHPHSRTSVLLRRYLQPAEGSLRAGAQPRARGLRRRDQAGQRRRAVSSDGRWRDPARRRRRDGGWR